MGIAEAQHHFDRRPNSAIAKYAFASEHEPVTPSLVHPCTDLIGSPQVPVLTFPGYHAIRHPTGNIRTLVAVDLSLPGSVIQSLRRTAHLCCDRHHRLETRAMPGLVLRNHPSREAAHFREQPVCCVAHETPVYSEVGVSRNRGGEQTGWQSGQSPETVSAATFAARLLYRSSVICT